MTTQTRPSRDHLGLTSEEAARIRASAGWNELPRAKPPSMFAVFSRQFRGMLVLILFVAAAIALALGEEVDAIAIFMVLVLNAVLGFVQEWRAETALEALRSILSPRAIAVRDGQERDILARELVPGDVVIVSTGDAVPADLRLLAAVEVRADESVLTGESVAVAKTVQGSGDDGALFAGTTLVAGRAEGQVTAIGLDTRLGRVAELTAQIGEKRTNLQKRLGDLAQQIGLAALLIAAAVVAIGMLGGRPLFEMFMTGLSLAVAMVPEGLPAVVTITLALGASAMARKKALARRLQAVETLGAASVICTDKTGTLTENQMTVTQFWTPEHRYRVTGEGYDPMGHIERDGERVRASDDPVLAAALQTALVCTHASLRKEDDGWKMIGAPTEGALVTLAFKGWAPAVAASDRIAEVPFSSERKRMSVLAQSPVGPRLYVKGAPEVILGRSTRVLGEEGATPLTPAIRTRAETAYEAMAAEGQRVLALAVRDTSVADLSEEDLVFVGLVGMIDPPRKEVAQAIAMARAAGIRVIMITGDGATTAAAIARQIGLDAPRPILGRDLDDVSQAELSKLVNGDVLFARTRPEHKLRIVEALQSGRQIVAMTGDGVNDAPALKRSDIGVAMGIRGTEVSKGAADLVLLDDNFATIVNAIGEGRRQFDNVRKFVRYLLSSNAGEVVAIVVNLLIGGPLIFLATQILWMNLITDSVTAVALGLEKSEPEQMKRPPRRANEPILDRNAFWLILCFGLYTSAASLWIFYSLLPLGTDLARTAAFTGMLVFEKVSVFAFRTLTRPVSSIGWFSNRVLIAAFSVSLLLQIAAVYWAPLQLLLRTVPLSLEHWLTIGLLALPLVIVPDAVKFARLRGTRTGMVPSA